MANSKKPSTAAPAASEPVVAPVAAAAPAAAPAAKKAPSKKADAAAPVAAPVVAAPVATEAAPAAKKAPSKKAAAPAAAAPAATTEAAPAPAKKAPVKKAAAAPAAATEAAPASTDAAAAPKAKASRSKKQESAPAAAPAAPSAIIVDVEVPESKAPLDARGRRIVSKDTVRDDFSSLIALINEQVEKASAPAPAAETPAAEGDAAAEGAAKKTTKRKKVEVGLSMKTLRSISKRLTVLTSDACKMMKLKNKISRDNTNSGLMKPVGLSDALFKFLKAAKFEVDAKGQYARTDITKKLHAYIKDNNLRKETDKRIIVPDTKLAALLNYDANTANEEMTYFRLPVYLKSHFVKLE